MERLQTPLLQQIPGPGAGQTEPTLIDSRFDADSCGVGFVATTTRVASHDIVEHALTALARLAHRGATAADGKSSDGVGIMAAVPRELLLSACGLTLDAEKPLAVGMVFLPVEETRAEAVLERCLSEQGWGVLAWRDVPVATDALGEIALGVMPRIRQVLATAADQRDPAEQERSLYLARKTFERAHARGEVTGYVCSLSHQTTVYKAMCAGTLLSRFYPDLADARFTSAFAIFHQRYATNTAPSWDRAQPGRAFAHNGEINTVWGNRSRMRARAPEFDEELTPVLTKGGTDSTSLDEAIELISKNGRTLAEAVRLLLPPATTAPRESTFLRYHADCAEPWDGPAAIAFSDGRVVGAALDRNGLRPSRFAVTLDGLVIAGSEAGLIDLEPERVVHSGRLGPGQMIVVDLEKGEVLENEALLDLFDSDPVYAQRLDPIPFEAADRGELCPQEQVHAWQLGFGYTREDVKMVLAPMAAEGKDSVWSMGDDTPLAFLARTPRPLYGYFRQRFAQVTNPAIDSLREAIVLSLHTRLGPWSSMLDKHAPLPGVSLASPYLSLAQVAALRRGEHPHADVLPVAELPCVYAAGTTLEAAVGAMCEEASRLVKIGAAILILSDRSAHAGEAETACLPIPMAIALSAVHEALIERRLRNKCGLLAEAGDCRDIHHGAVLIGHGVGAVCPWLALETARLQSGLEPAEAERKMLKSFDAGLAKVMSKMGISVVDSYRGAHLFDILGLHETVTQRCFPETPSALSGIGFAELDRQLRQTWLHEPAPAAAELPDYGWVRFRKTDLSEPHHWQPGNVRALQTVVGSTRAGVPAADPAAAFAIFTEEITSREPGSLRNLLEIQPAGPQIDLAEVEPAKSLYTRFVSSAMSLGSLSPEAHSCITAAMNMLGGRSNTGEGGEDREVYRKPAPVASGPSGGSGASTLSSGGTAVAELAPALIEAPMVLNNKIKQIASGRFGVTAEYLAHADEIEIKVAQGAKPGEGGQLPGHKVSGLIARLRHAQPGVSLISPPPHHDIYSIEDLAQLIYDLKRVNPRASVGVKLVSSLGVGTVAAGVAKAYADFIVIAGNTGGTGAAALSSIKYAGNPWELGLSEAQQMLTHHGMRGRVRLRTDGGLATAQDVLIAALLGADEFAFGTAVLVAIGCDMARQCHLNTCPTGIATQKPELRAKFRGKPEHIVRFFEELAADLRQMLARYGLRSIEEAIGRTDLLEQVRHDNGLDLRPMLARPHADAARRWEGVRNDQPEEEPALDEAWTKAALEAVQAGAPFAVDAAIANKDRAVGARLAGELSLLRAQADLPVDVTLRLTGTGGQSFGAFAVEGMTLILEGQANDFVGKGLSGGTLVMRARGLAARNSGDHVILGNVALYGATAGTLFAAGRAGERFAVRNSGVTAVVEGVGDHGCEYMTGGTVAVLGRAGINFAAGMTGGTAWIYDEDGSFLAQRRFHQDYVTPDAFATLPEEDRASLRALITLHAEQAASSLAASMLAEWETHAARFLRLSPKPQV